MGFGFLETVIRKVMINLFRVVTFCNGVYRVVNTGDVAFAFDKERNRA